MTRGGVRRGAGRPKGLGKFGEKTKPLRVPERMIPQILHFIKNPETPFDIPIYSKNIIENKKKMNLNTFLIKEPSSTFFVKITDDLMLDAGIKTGDLAIVYRNNAAKPDSIVAVLIDEEIAIRHYIKKEKKEYLLTNNKGIPPLEITENVKFCILGIVTNIVHQI